MAEKKRHGCLTAWLVLMIVANSVTALLYLVGFNFVKDRLPNIPNWSILLFAILAAFNVVCAIALFKWKKWGFWGFLINSVIALCVNFYVGLGIGNSLTGMLGIEMLYIILQIGKENKGWPQLE